MCTRVVARVYGVYVCPPVNRGDAFAHPRFSLFFTQSPISRFSARITEPNVVNKVWNPPLISARNDPTSSAKFVTRGYALLRTFGIFSLGRNRRERASPIRFEERNRRVRLEPESPSSRCAHEAEASL